MRTQCFQKINENKKFFDEAVIITVMRRHLAITNHTITCTILITVVSRFISCPTTFWLRDFDETALVWDQAAVIYRSAADGNS